MWEVISTKNFLTFPLVANRCTFLSGRPNKTLKVVRVYNFTVARSDNEIEEFCYELELNPQIRS